MKIYPRREICGVFEAPPDKTVTETAIILGSLSKTKTYIINPLYCRDTYSAINCVKKLGAKVKVKKQLIEIRRGKKINDGVKLDCGNSGTVMRLLCGVAAGSGISAVLTCDKFLAKRHMKSVKDPLEQMGATVSLNTNELPPIKVEGDSVKPIEYTLKKGGSQVKSAILLCALQGEVKAEIEEENMSNNHAEILLEQLGASITYDDGKVVLDKSELKGGKIFVSGDFGSAAYLLALGLLLGKVTVKNVGVNPTRTGLLKILKRMGAHIEIENRRMLCGERIADITAYKSDLKATHVVEDEYFGIIDEIPVLSVLMGVAEGESIICGPKGFVNEERMNSVAEMIKSVGGSCEVFNTGVVIHGVSKYRGGEVETHGDHRLHMSATVALLASSLGGETEDDDSVEVSFPDFYKKIYDSNYAVLGTAFGENGACEMYGYIAEEMNIKNYCMSQIEPNDDNQKKAFSELKNYAGYVVVAPYSGEAIKHVMKLSSIAKLSRSVNIVRGNTGNTTDGYGAIYAIKYRGYDPAGKRVLILGGGYAARSIAVSLAEQKAKVTFFIPDQKSASEMKQRPIEGTDVIDLLPKKGYDVIVNALSFDGEEKDGFTRSAPVLSLVDSCVAAIDLTLSDERSEFASYAEDKGLFTADGNTVSFFTAYISNCIFTGRPFYEKEAIDFFAEYEAVISAKKEERSPEIITKAGFAGLISPAGMAKLAERSSAQGT